MVEVLLAGWGEKQGTRFTTWQRRFFVLRTATEAEAAGSGCTHTLLYYKTLAQVTSRSPALGAVAITRGSTTVSDAFKKCRGSARRCLLIQSPNTKDIYLCPDDEMEEWKQVMSSLDPPSNSEELRHSFVGDTPLDSDVLAHGKAAGDEEEGYAESERAGEEGEGGGEVGAAATDGSATLGPTN
eukprot:m.106217 g.106217  ORF g.106217 m.106217 type:complete len:184 (+) comp12688_c0_seq3:473-1024(+)